MWKQYVPTHRALSIWLVMRPVRAMQDRKNGSPWSITGFSPFPLFRHHLFPNPSNKPPYTSFFPPIAQQPIVCHGFHIIEASRSHSLDTHVLGRTPLDLWSARRTDLYMTTHNNLMRQTSIRSVIFESTITASERPQTHALDRATTGIGACTLVDIKYCVFTITFKIFWRYVSLQLESDAEFPREGC